MVCTARPLPVDRSMTAAQGPQGQTNLTDVLAAHSCQLRGDPARQTQNRLTGAKARRSALRATPTSSTPFQDPRGSARALRELGAAVRCRANRVLEDQIRPSYQPTVSTCVRTPGRCSGKSTTAFAA